MDDRSKILLSIGMHLRQLLHKRALSCATVDKACCSYYEFLYQMRNSTASTIHLVLHFTTFNNKGRSKLGEILDSNAIASNIGCELVDFVEKRCKTNPATGIKGIVSVGSDLNINTVQNVSEILPSPETEDIKNPSVGKTKRSRWKRFKEKMALRSTTRSLQTKGKQPIQHMDTGASVDVCRAPSAVDQLSLIPDGPKKMITSSATPFEKEAENAIIRAGYAAKVRLDAGDHSQWLQDMRTLKRAAYLPLRIPVTREMEPQVCRPAKHSWKKAPAFNVPVTNMKQTVSSPGPSFKPQKRRRNVKKKQIRPTKRSTSPISTKDYCN